MSDDKRTIGVSSESQMVLDLIEAKTLYQNQVDAARFAVSLALAKGLKPTGGSDLSTKWNVGTFDPEGNMRSAILAYYPQCDEPYRFAEGLLEAGLFVLRDHIQIQGQVDFELLINEIKTGISTGKDA